MVQEQRFAGREPCLFETCMSGFKIVEWYWSTAEVALPCEGLMVGQLRNKTNLGNVSLFHGEPRYDPSVILTAYSARLNGEIEALRLLFVLEMHFLVIRWLRSSQRNGQRLVRLEWLMLILNRVAKHRHLV